MKKINFLNKLKKEKKLELVDPSEEISKSYLEKSESNLISAKILLENNRLEEAVSLAYYSMYNQLLSLLFETGIKSENHMGSIILLKEIFSVDNSDILKAKKERVDKQYYVDFVITRSETEYSIKIAEKFNHILYDFISKISTNDVMKYRDKFLELIENA